MKDFFKQPKSAGISLLEVICSLGLLGFVINWTAHKMSQDERNISDLEKRLSARHLVDRTTSQLLAQPQFFPPLAQGGGSTSMVYVACFLKGGIPTKNSSGVEDFVALSMNDPKLASGLCKDALFEIHVLPSLDKLKTAELSVFVYDMDRQGMKFLFANEVALSASI